MKHYVLTRFNLGMYSGNKMFAGCKRNLCPDAWMAHRINLFLTLTVPSMKAQSNQNFTWFVLVDAATPEIFKHTLAKINCDTLHFIYVDGESMTDAVLRDIEPGEYDLITTRLDNDDLLHQNAINDIQNLYDAAAELPYVIDIPHGFTFDLKARKIHPTTYPGNANISLVERSIGAKTVWHDQHGKIYNLYPHFETHESGWMITIHSQNLENNTKSSPGREIYTDYEVPLEKLTEFGVKLDELELNNDYR